MSSCICPPTGWLDPDCPKHGLPGDTRYPPMDRHAREITVTEERVVKAKGAPPCVYIVTVTRKETAAEVQRRLYNDAHPPTT